MDTLQSAGQSASKTETFKALLIKQITSPEEKKNNAQSYIAIIPIRDVLGINTEENPRFAYTDDASAKKKTAVHNIIEESLGESPDRFIQRHSGFEVVCDEIKIDNPKNFGISSVTLFNASLINGAQSQGIIDNVLSEISKDDFDYSDYEVHVRILITVEKNQEERLNISDAKNNHLKVHDVSRMSSRNYFSIIDTNMQKYGHERLMEAENDHGISPPKVLQVTRAMIPEDLREGAIEKKIVISYSSSNSVLKEYKEIWDTSKETRLKENKHFESDLLRFYETFSPIAWELYESWSHDIEWKKYWKRSDKSKRLGKYNENKNTFELAFGVLIPTLYGLSNFITENPTTNSWDFKLSSKFDKSDYMKTVFDEFKTVYDYNPQDFGKDRSVYFKLWMYTSKKK